MLTQKKNKLKYCNLFALLTTFDINPSKHLIMAGDFDLFFDSKFDAAGETLHLKESL